MSDIAIAALLALTILIASMISVEIGLAVALIELVVGVVVGNAFSLDVPNWLAFIGSFAGVVLTFQAGAEVDVPQFKREWRPSLAIGLSSFFAPFVVAGLVAYYGLGWNHRQAEIGGLALSTTSLGRLRGARRDGAQPRARRQAADVGDVRDRHRDRDRADRALREADALDRAVRRGVAPPDLRAAADLTGVFLFLWRPGDRAGDQAGVRVALSPDVARRARQFAAG